MKKIAFFIGISICFFLFIAYQKQPKTIQNLRLNVKVEPKTLDPRKGGDLYSSQMHFLFFEGLMKRHPDCSIHLAQAESYEVSEDNLVYTFHLRDTVWSDNTPVTAYDFEQSWKDILDPIFPSMNAQLLSPIKNADAAKKGLVSLDELGIKAIDAKTLVITLEKPTPYFLELLAFCVLFPVQIENDRKNPNWAKSTGPNFLCNGPYILEKWDEHQIIAIRNPTYRKTKDLRANKIVFNIVQDDKKTLQMFEDGLIDMVGGNLNSIPLEEIPHLEKKWDIFRKEFPRTRMIAFNTEKFPFTNLKIRKAFAFAINRQELIGLFGNGVKKNIRAKYINTAYQASTAATNMIPPCLKENRYRFFFKDNDVVQAKALLEEGLKELGITKEIFHSITLYYDLSYSHTDKLIQAIQQQWLAALGIFIKTECVDYRVVLDRLTNGNYCMAHTEWTAMYFDQMGILERFKYKTHAKNFTNWENQEYIQLLDRSFYEQKDARLQTLEQAEKLFISEMPLIPLYHEDDVYIISPQFPFIIPLWGDLILQPRSLSDGLI